MKQAATICLTITALFALSGCATIDNGRNPFTAPSFAGKELPPESLTIQSKTDNGHKHRGFNLGKRHWDF